MSLETPQKYLNNLLEDQVEAFIGESDHLQDYREELLILRDINGWCLLEDMPILPPDGKMVIKTTKFNGSDNSYEPHYRTVDDVHRSKFEDILKMNRIPDWARDLEIVDFLPVNEYGAVRRIVESISSKIADEAQGYDKWSQEDKKEFLKKWGMI